MRGKSLALLVLALGCGLVASIGITQVMAKRNTTPTALPADMETIFVAMEDIALGDPLVSQVLRLEQWPKDKVPTGALTRIEDIEGRRTKAKLYAGEPVLENKLFPKGIGVGSSSGRIPEGYRVIPVRVDIGSGGAGLILPGDRVDVAVYLKSVRGSCNSSSVRTILQDIKVFAVNNVVGFESESSHDKSISAKTISLLVTPEQANKLMLATELGKVRLVMRSPIDDKRVDAVDVSHADLLGKSDASDREQERLVQETDPGAQNGGFLQFLKQANQPPASTTGAGIRIRPAHQMRVMRGDNVEIVALEPAEALSSHASGFGLWRMNSLILDADVGEPGAESEEYEPEDDGQSQEDEEPETDGEQKQEADN